ncbi:Tn3 family transposase [Micromonospora sp. NPDC023814]|uniref:Tn3 family transposase n=1 Tax=Micromonospora sp. NPDC023814 TaxID=3154596 RepID=UPI0033D00A7D
MRNADFLPASPTSSPPSRVRALDRPTLQRRLLLALFVLGTRMGIRAIVATGERGETEASLRHVRRVFVTVDNLRAAVAKLVNATFAARDATWRGYVTHATCGSCQ